MVRAVVLVMTLSSVVAGIMLAMTETTLMWDRVIALVIGLTLAHATNNLINDWTDTHMGIDEDNYFRRQYGTHVLEDGLVSRRNFWLTTIVTGLLALSCGIYLVAALGTIVLYLTLAGAFFVLFYTWPLKHWGLGELAVFLVWGPLLTAGSFWVLTEHISSKVFLVSLLVGIGPTFVILGKHMDKYSYDLPRAVKTLPVVIGLPASRNLMLALLLVQWLLIIFLFSVYGMNGLLFCLLSLIALRPLVISLKAPHPESPPEDYPADVWPLWYSAFAFRYCRDFGFCLLIGLLVPLF